MAIYDETITGSASVASPLTDFVPTVYSETASSAFTASSSALTVALFLDSVPGAITGTPLVTPEALIGDDITASATVAASMSSVADVFAVVESAAVAYGFADKRSEFASWVLNTDTSGFTRYEGFEFESFFTHEGKVYGTTRSGVFALGGDTDAGNFIAGHVATGGYDYGNADLKHCLGLYLGGKLQPLSATVVVDDSQSYTYQSQGNDTTSGTVMVPVGRGIRARYWQVLLDFEDVSGVELDYVEPKLLSVRRRTDGSR